MGTAESSGKASAFRGTPEQLVSNLEARALVPEDVSLCATVQEVRRQGLDLEESSRAIVHLARALEWKVRLLLPAPPPLEPEAEIAEEDADSLAERLGRYEVFAEARDVLRGLERQRQTRFGRPTSAPTEERPLAAETLDRLLDAFAEVWERAGQRTQEVRRDAFTVAEAIVVLRGRITMLGDTPFGSLFSEDASRAEIIALFLALLELVRLGECAVQQGEPFGSLRVVAARSEVAFTVDADRGRNGEG